MLPITISLSFDTLSDMRNFYEKLANRESDFLSYILSLIFYYESGESSSGQRSKTDMVIFFWEFA
jgi:hypothetical protein